ncbi:MAG: hypothetical protein LBK13_07495, partial [Spirochaetales bacterium]|nr:hypothetical protein [Spirochaetales bacterium]
MKIYSKQRCPKNIQQFKVSPIGSIFPDEKDKSRQVFMEKTTEGVPHGVKKLIPAAKPIPGFTVLLIPHKQYR